MIFVFHLKQMSSTPAAHLVEGAKLICFLCWKGVLPIKIVVLELGFPAGPQIGKALTALLECVQDEILTNTKEDLLAAAEKLKE